MRESRSDGGSVLRDKKPSKFRTEGLLTVSGSPRYYLARIWSPEKCRIITLKCLFSFRRRMIYMRPARNWRPHQKTISLMTTLGPRRKENCQVIFIHIVNAWTEVLKRGKIMEYYLSFQCMAVVTETMRRTLEWQHATDGCTNCCFN